MMHQLLHEPVMIIDSLGIYNTMYLHVQLLRSFHLPLRHVAVCPSSLPYLSPTKHRTSILHTSSFI